MPSLCSLLHHYPLLPVLQNPMQAEGEVTTLNAGGYSYRGKGGRRQNRNASATITKPAKVGQTTMTVTVPQETNKCKVESRGESPCPKHAYKRKQQGKG